MTQNRVKELREARGWSVRQLAEKAGFSHGYIVRIENGERGLSVKVARRIASALEKPVSDVLALNSGTKPAEESTSPDEAEPYVANADDPVMHRLNARDSISPYVAKTDGLDALNIRKGDIVFVDVSQAAIDALRSQQCVIAQHYTGEMTAVTVLRQYIAPSLLITNSKSANEPSLRLDDDGDDVAIKGVIVGTYTRFGVG